MGHVLRKTIFTGLLVLSTALGALAQETITIGKRLSGPDLSEVLRSTQLDGYSFVTGKRFGVVIEPGGSALFSAPGSDNTAAKWSITRDQLCFLYQGAANWSCRTGYQTSDGRGVVLVDDSEGELIAISRLLPRP